VQLHGTALLRTLHVGMVGLTHFAEMIVAHPLSLSQAAETANVVEWEKRR